MDGPGNSSDTVEVVESATDWPDEVSSLEIDNSTNFFPPSRFKINLCVYEAYMGSQGRIWRAFRAFPGRPWRRAEDSFGH